MPHWLDRRDGATCPDYRVQTKGRASMHIARYRIAIAFAFPLDTMIGNFLKYDSLQKPGKFIRNGGGNCDVGKLSVFLASKWKQLTAIKKAMICQMPKGVTSSCRFCLLLNVNKRMLIICLPEEFPTLLNIEKKDMFVCIADTFALSHSEGHFMQSLLLLSRRKRGNGTPCCRRSPSRQRSL